MESYGKRIQLLCIVDSADSDVVLVEEYSVVARLASKFRRVARKTAELSTCNRSRQWSVVRSEQALVGLISDFTRVCKKNPVVDVRELSSGNWFEILTSHHS